MSEMIETVARALWEDWRRLDVAAPAAIDLDYDGLLALAELPEGAVAKQFIEAGRSQARAALAAMREPTEEMVEAGGKVITRRDGYAAVWIAMIDAAGKDVA